MKNTIVSLFALLVLVPFSASAAVHLAPVSPPSADPVSPVDAPVAPKVEPIADPQPQPQPVAEEGGGGMHPEMIVGPTGRTNSQLPCLARQNAMCSVVDISSTSYFRASVQFAIDQIKAAGFSVPAFLLNQLM